MREGREWRPTEGAQGSLGVVQIEPHDRAATFRRLGEHSATVGFYHLFDDREAEARTRHGPSGGRAIETIEYLVAVCCIDPGTVIPYGDMATGDLHFDWSVVGAPLHRIVQEVVDSARECRRATLDRAGLRIEPDLDIESANGALDTRCNGLVEEQVLGRSFRMSVRSEINNFTDKQAYLALDQERGTLARVGFLTNQPRTFGVTARIGF